MEPPVAIQFCATFLKPEMLHVYRQITGLRRWQPTVLTWKREEAQRFPFERVVTLPRPRTRGLRRLVVRQWLRRPVQIYPGEARRIAREIGDAGGKVLHVYFGHIAVQLLPLLRRPPVPVVVSFHGADALVDLEKPAYRRATLEMLGLARLVLVRSRSLAQGLIRLGCPEGKIRIHRTGIPLERFAFHERAVPADGAWSFLQACRLIEKKGLFTTLAAFARFAQVYPRARLVIAGEGPLLAPLEAEARRLGVAVHFPGFLSQQALKAAMDGAHAFVHPSEMGRDGNQEGVPNSMLEAMATGLPVLATRHGGIPEAVDDGEAGYLVGEGDAGALGEAMLRLAAGPERYPLLARAAAAAVAQRFEQGRQVAVLEGYYDEACRPEAGENPGVR